MQRPQRGDEAASYSRGTAQRRIVARIQRGTDMPIHFPTDAANDPGIDDADRTGRARARGKPAHHSRTSADSQTDESKPGKGINQAGFVRERDPGDGRDTE